MVPKELDLSVQKELQPQICRMPEDSEETRTKIAVIAELHRNLLVVRGLRETAGHKLSKRGEPQN